jgi:hypothetical protein
MTGYGPFAVRAEIDTPISVRDHLHLDALMLEGVRRLHGRPIPPDQLPIAFRDSVPLASAAVFETVECGAVRFETARLRSNIARRDDPERVHVTPDMPRVLRIVGADSPYRAGLETRHMATGIRAAWFTATGDADATMQILSEIEGLGAMAATGYGRVVSWSLHRIANSHADVGWKDGAGKPLRAIPLQAWTTAGGDVGFETAEVRAAPPYWSGPATLCVVPRLGDLVGRREAVVAMIGVEEEW